MDTSDFKPKSFWERKEGTTGMITLAALAVGGVLIGKAVLPTIISFLGLAITAVGQLFVLGGLCVALAAFLFIVTNKQFQLIISNIFKLSMRAITGMIIEIDPIGIMRNYIDILKDKKRTMDENISALAGQVATIKQTIQNNASKIDNAMSTARIAQEKGMQMQFTLQARSAGRLEKSNVTYQQMLDKMNILLRALKKYQEATAVTIVDLTEEVDVKSRERQAIIAASKAMNGAMAILRGSGPEKDMFDQAMEFTAADYGRRLGEIDDFMDTTKSILEGMDLQNGVYDQQAMDKLAAWESKADSLVLGGDKRLLLEGAQVNLQPTNFHLNAAPAVSAAAGEDYSKFFRA